MTLRQLTGLDANFLYLETGRSFGHVSSLSIYGRPDDPGFEPFEAFREQMRRRLHLIEPFRRRVIEVPFGLDRPYWIVDPDFDLDYHVRHIGLPAPGSVEQLSEQVARIVGRPLDRAHPLWEAYVIEGLDGGDFAVLTMVHHATIDGASGVELLTIMLDDSPEVDTREAPDLSWDTDDVPSSAELLGRTAISLASNPARAGRLGLRVIGEAARAARRVDVANVADAVRRRLSPARDGGDQPPRLPTLAAPPTPFNRSITPHRRVAIGSVPLADVKTVKQRLGVTVNDVVMAVCAGAVRRYLEGHDALPAEALTAMVPVSIRTGGEADRWTNRVSALFARLPTDEEDPIARVHAVHTTMGEAKDRFDLMPADLIIELNQFTVPALATRALRLAAATRIADWTRPPFNLVISNVPGPRQTLYVAGAPMKHYFPVSTIVDGQGLNLTVQSYCDTLDFGLVACRELVPDLWDLLGLCLDEVAVLVDASRGL